MARFLKFRIILSEMWLAMSVELLSQTTKVLQAFMGHLLAHGGGDGSVVVVVVGWCGCGGSVVVGWCGCGGSVVPVGVVCLCWYCTGGGSDSVVVVCW